MDACFPPHTSELSIDLARREVLILYDELEARYRINLDGRAVPLENSGVVSVTLRSLQLCTVSVSDRGGAPVMSLLCAPARPDTSATESVVHAKPGHGLQKGEVCGSSMWLI